MYALTKIVKAANDYRKLRGMFPDVITVSEADYDLYLEEVTLHAGESITGNPNRSDGRCHVQFLENFNISVVPEDTASSVMAIKTI
jgi:hypothetical protein